MSVQTYDVIAFTEQFANMIEAGIPLANCLNALGHQEENADLKAIIQEVEADIEDGDLLSEALAKHKKAFSHFYVSLIFAGEQGAGLPLVLNQIVQYMEKDYRLKQKVKSAFMYPLVMVSFCVLIVVFLLVFVVPVFAKVYTQMGVSLPLPTRILLMVSYLARKYWWVTLVITLSATYTYRRLKKEEFGQELIDWLVIRFPIWGKLSQRTAVAKFIRSFSNMLICKVSMIDAISIADQITGSRMIHKICNEIKDTIKGGGRVTDVMAEKQVFPPVVVQMTHAGEESGRVGELLEKCGEGLDIGIEQSIKKLLMVLEPTITIVVAALVGFIALSIYLPMFDLMSVQH